MGGLRYQFGGFFRFSLGRFPPGVPARQQYFEPKPAIVVEVDYFEPVFCSAATRSGSTALRLEDLKMRKLVVALTAIAAFSSSALAADLSPRTYTKAPPPVMAPSWTGFYLFGGGGYGIFDSNTFVRNAAGTALTIGQTNGGDGYFGTVGGGYDWQFSGSWVAGIFADAQFGSIRGSESDLLLGASGALKDRTNVAAGARLGYLVAPNVLSYVNGGYSYGQFSGSTLLSVGGAPLATTTSFNRNGWFVGGGVENSLNIFGITAPGWFMKTEYRAAQYDRATLPETSIAGVVGNSISTKPLVETVSTSLVYRFNWTGPVVAKY
jgi:outer membrane immunogenic protein